MRILMVTRQYPYPVMDGESIAIDFMSRGLHEAGAQLDLFAMNTAKHHHVVSPKDLPVYDQVVTVDLDNRVTAVSALANLFSSDPYHISRYRSEAVAIRLRDLVRTEDYDIIQIEGLQGLIYLDTLREASNAQIVYRAHNVEHQIWRRIARQSHWLKAQYLYKQVQRLEQYEKGRCKQVDAIIPVSAVDAVFFENIHDQVHIAPIGEEAKSLTYRGDSSLLRVGFIGSMDWRPNQEGLEWYLDEVFDGTYDLVLAGRHFDKWSCDIPHADRVQVLGEIEDASVFWKQIDILIVPLFTGSGTRVKIIQAMSMSVPVLATTIGAEGIDVTHDQTALIADSIQAWRSALKWAVDHPLQLRDIGRAAHEHVFPSYDYKEVAARLIDFYEQRVLLS